MHLQKLSKPACWFALLLSGGLLNSAQAATITNLDAAVNLNLGGSWVGGTPAGASDVAVWNNLIQLNTTKALGANLGWAGIQLIDPVSLVTISAGNTLTLGASGIDMSVATTGLTLSAPVVLGASQNWNVANGQSLLLSGAVSGTGSLTLNGSGTTVLGVANTYSGGTTNTSGILQINSATALGNGPITLNGGTWVLPSPGVTVATPIISVAGATSTIVVTNTSANPILGGTWTGAGTIIVTNSFNPFTVNGVMDNFAGTIVVPGNATFRFNSGGGSTSFGSLNATFDLGNGTAILQARNAATINLGALKGGFGTVLTGQGSGSGTLTWSIGNNNLSTTFNGTIKNNSATALSALTKVGNGTLTLTGTNTFTGAVKINAGTLQIGDGGADGFLAGGAIANSGSLVFNRSDSYTVANNISGSGSVTVQAGGTNTYSGANTSSGTTIINSGALILTGTMSCPVAVGSAGTFDVSQIAFNLNQSLSGSGTVTGLVTAVGGSINPGGTGVAGTLTFASGLTESGSVNHQLALSTPAGTNDLINVVGDLNLAGTNNLLLSHFGGGTIPNGIYPLFHYSGNLIGTLSNLAVVVTGVNGTLTNLPNQIAIIITPSARGATNLTWVGDGSANNWDLATSNWVSGVTAFSFKAGDKVTFDNTGAANSTVTLASLVSPASVTVNSTANYTLTGLFGISDSTAPTGLLKTNSGTLSLSSPNSYTGPTVVGGGTLEVFTLANGGSASSIGAAGSDPTNLVIYSSVYKYSGATAATDRGATLKGSGATFDIAPGVNLTENGTLTGPGALTLIDSGTLTLAAANSYAGGTVISNGVLATANDTANTGGFGPATNLISFYGGTLALYRSDGDDGSTAYNLNNPLSVPGGQTGNLNVFQRGTVNSALTGSGILNLVNTGPGRTAFAGNWSAFTGTINLTGSFRVANTSGYSNAVFYLNDQADLDGGVVAGAFSTSPVFDLGELDGTSLAHLGFVTKPTPNPTWRIGWKNTTSTFAGIIQNPAGGVNSIIKVGTGALVLSGQSTYTGSTIISNGVLVLTNNAATATDGAISGSTNIFINSGAFLDVVGRSDGTMPLNGGQVVSGNGTLRGILDTAAGGTVSPGGGIYGGLGTLTVTNTINLGGIAWMKLNRSLTPNSDRLVCSTAGVINYGGTLMLTNLGPRLQAGDTFTLFSAAARNNSFTLALPNYYTWDTSQLNSSGQVSVTGVLAAPSISSVDYSGLAGGNLTINGINGIPGSSVNVLSSTNLNLPLSSWTLAGTGNFDGSGNASVSVTVDPALPQNYFLLQVN